MSSISPEVSISVCIWPKGKHSYCVYGCDIGPEAIDEINRLGVGKAQLIPRLGPGNFSVDYTDGRSAKRSEHALFELIATKCCDKDAVITVVHRRLTEGVIAPEVVSSATAVVVDGEFSYVAEAVEPTEGRPTPVPEFNKDLTQKLLDRYDPEASQE